MCIYMELQGHKFVADVLFEADQLMQANGFFVVVVSET